MKLRQGHRASVGLALILSMASGIVGSIASTPVRAGERKFLVMLADSPKHGRVRCSSTADCTPLGSGYVCGDAGIGEPVCVVPCTSDAGCVNVAPPDVACHPSLRICDDRLANPELIRRQYFDKSDPTIGSFAEYWEEISYGDVTVTGQVTDWIMLPWPLTGTFEFTNLNPVVNGVPEPAVLDYGAGEVFDNTRPMIGVNIGGPVRDPDYLLGAKQQTWTGNPVWTPGERFLDLNRNGVWDGWPDEARNEMDFRDNTQPFCNNTTIPCLPPDGKPDLLGPWIDLNGNGVPDNAPGCVYLPDSDNDGNPDCCPNGLGKPGCGFGQTGTGSCPILQVSGGNDCNGNGIPDVCDLSCTSQACVDTGWVQQNDPNRTLCGKSADQLPFAASSGRCNPTPDGIPDECQFANPGTRCVQGTINCTGENADPCCSTANTPCQTFTPPTRCEYHDVNGNGVMDVVEPFENYIQGVPFVRPSPFPPPDDPGWVPDWDYDNYVWNNFPGYDPNVVIRRKNVRKLAGLHDPLNKAPNDCVCSDGLPCRSIELPNGVFLSRACPAGFHAEYDPPDFWVESAAILPPEAVGPTKYEFVSLGKVTLKPDWFDDAWRDRYGGAEPPSWDFIAKREVPIDPLIGTPKPFAGDRGGVNGRGAAPAGIDLSQVPILPDQLLGVGIQFPLTLYDGPVEFDDVPSSKYHRTGDMALGEVTSPFGPAISGQDRGTNNPNNIGVPDGILPAAGPYATRLHGQNGRDAGNTLQFEWHTWRTSPPFNDGSAWDDLQFQRSFFGEGRLPNPLWNYPPHPYAGPSGGYLGFRDYNLDGRLDIGETRRPGNGFYSLPFDFRDYPFNRQRLIEDCVEILDETIDFDGFVDPVSLEAIKCPADPPYSYLLPSPYESDGFIRIAGAQSGIVLLPPFKPGFPNRAPSFSPIHNEDGLNDPVYTDSNFPKAPRTSHLNWNILFHDLVHVLGSPGEGGTGSGDFGATFAAHEYGHAWQHFPDLYDYDVLDNSGAVNCPIGAWDLMATGGLVHPIPALKEMRCTKWVDVVDLATVLTPGVEKVITLPPAELIRDNSYYYLQNEDRPGEKLYFWSAGTKGFDLNMPGSGLLILHADPNDGVDPSNPDAIALQQRSGIRPAYRIVQADGLAELEAGPGVDSACGDAGDPWPGSSGNTLFDCSTLPASQWYTDHACTGLEILNIMPSADGAVQVTFNWIPTSIPGLRFIAPPGGVTVGQTYKVRAEVNDVYGGTWVRFYHTNVESAKPKRSDGVPFALVRKTIPATTEVSADWNVAGLADGRYFIFADLIPDQGADGFESKLTKPRAGRNNRGSATLTKADVDVDVSTVAGGVVTHEGKSRFETWTVECVDSVNGRWVVSSSLTQPALPGDANAAMCNNQLPATCANRARCATTGTPYTSCDGEVTFTIGQGAGALGKGVVGDTFTFTTTGLTALSSAATLSSGTITENPTAVIDASPLSGLPPLTVTFDARRSRDPNGQALSFTWTFGDGSPSQTGAQVQHTYTQAGKFTVVLRATNTSNGRFGEAAVDIEVINNAPKAVIKANPTSGPAPLTVSFSATDSSDAETPANQLIYQWNFGDGLTANDQKTPGILSQTSHLYTRKADGTLCTNANPCAFTATLTVTDTGGKSSTDTIVISVGNTNPVPNITVSTTQGNSPLTVVFNAKNSTDVDNDTLTVEWNWGDGSAVESYPAKTGKPPATDGSVPHTYTLPAGQTSATFTPKAIVKDNRGGSATWPGITITVTSAGQSDSAPRALFTVTPAQPLLNQKFTVDASQSFDRPAGGQITAYEWDWGDGTPRSTGVRAEHTYTRAGTFRITLTVSDAETPPNKGTTQKTIVISSETPPPAGGNRAPSASLIVQPTEGFVDDLFTFDARGSTDPDGDALAYQFVFGDGEQTPFGSAATATHRYAAPGTYLTRLTVRDPSNASTDLTRSIRVLSPGDNRTPVALIATGQRTGAAPLTLTFDGRLSFDPDGDAIIHTWRFSREGVAVDTLTGSVVTRLFDEIGTYTVVLEVTDTKGLVGFSNPETVVVTEAGTPIEPPPPQPRPTPEPPPPSYLQRPTPICGVGMLMATLGSLLGLMTMKRIHRGRG